MYFVGDFDGRNFVADSLDYPLWLDSGSDNYAGVTWSNSPDGRTIYLGWMNNWDYVGQVPCSPWRSAMTLPRTLALEEMNGKPVITSYVVDELNNIAGEWKEAEDGICKDGDAYEMVVTLDPKENQYFNVGNSKGENISVEVNALAGRIIVSRTSASGKTSFNGNFSLPGMSALYDTSADEMELHIYVDHSSVELISGDGKSAITCLVYPTEPYDRISGIENVSYRTLKSIW